MLLVGPCDINKAFSHIKWLFQKVHRVACIKTLRPVKCHLEDDSFELTLANLDCRFFCYSIPIESCFEGWHEQKAIVGWNNVFATIWQQAIVQTNELFVYLRHSVRWVNPNLFSFCMDTLIYSQSGWCSVDYADTLLWYNDTLAIVQRTWHYPLRWVFLNQQRMTLLCLAKFKTGGKWMSTDI